MHIVVTGASGLLGLNLSLLAAAQGHAVTGLVHSQGLRGVPFAVKQVDLLDTENALSVIRDSKPDAIIHCAAIADLNAAEKAPEEAQRINAEVPGLLARMAASLGSSFVHISTDAVFDGTNGNYVESDQANPLSVYARTKLAGEQAVKKENADALIARVVFYGWSLSGDRSLSEFFFKNLKSGKQVEGFTDNYFCPLYVEDLGKTILEMMAAGLSGLYHVVSPENMSKYAFGVRIAERFGFDPNLIEPIKATSVDRGASRSLNLILNPEKLQSALGYSLPSIDMGVEHLFIRWQDGFPERLQRFRE